MDSELESPAGELLLVSFDPGAHTMSSGFRLASPPLFFSSSPLKQQVEPLPTPNLCEARVPPHATNQSLWQGEVVL